MVRMTQSFEVWLFKYHKDIFALIMFGHTELLTEEMQKDYFAWCLTDEGKQYLKGGSKYKPDHKGNIALEEANKGCATCTYYDTDRKDPPCCNCSGQNYEESKGVNNDR